MKKTLLALSFLGLVLAGCSKVSWIAKFYVVKAENAFTKAHALRIKPDFPQAKRLEYYRASCRDFRKAYDLDPAVYTLYRIEIAFDACLRVKASEDVELFRNFQEKYSREHPTEVKYGDTGAWMGLEG